MLKEIHIEGLGKIAIRKSKKARRITIRIKPGLPAEVVIPSWVSFRRGEVFANQKKGWIKKHYKRFNNLNHNKFHSESKLQTTFKTYDLHFMIMDSMTTTLKSNSIHIGINPSLTIESEQVQKAAEQGVLLALKFEARNYLPARLDQLSEQSGLFYNRLFIKNQKTLWGSCSSSNNINLNIQIMRLPTHLIDYVLMHELVHTQHKNHGPIFWKTLESHLTNSRTLAKELRSFRIHMSA